MTTANSPAGAGSPTIPLTPLAALHADILGCTRCQDAGYLDVACPLAAGGARSGARLMLIGQAPSKVAIRDWKPFAGVGGRKLVEWLAWAGLDEATFRREIYMTAMTKCFPGPHPKGKGDRKPSPAELALCRPFLDRQIALVDPGVILLVGGLAIESFLGKARLEDIVGDVQTRDGRLFLPLPHPSGVSTWLNDPAHVALVRRAAGRLRDWLGEHLPVLPLLPEATLASPRPAGGGHLERA